MCEYVNSNLLLQVRKTWNIYGSPSIPRTHVYPQGQPSQISNPEIVNHEGQEDAESEDKERQ